MKKKIIFILAGLILVAGIGYFVMFYLLANDPKGKIAKLQQKHKGYEELKVFESRYRFGIMDTTTKRLAQHITFDKNGKILTEEIFPPSQQTFGQATIGNIFDILGVNYLNPIEFNRRYFLGEGKKIVYSYNSENKLIQQTEYNSNDKKIIARVSNSYEDGLLRESNILYTKDSSTLFYTYDDKENEISYIRYTKDSTVLERSSSYNEYNDKNQLVEQRSLITSVNKFGNAGDSIIIIITYKYENNILSEYTRIGMFRGSEPSISIYQLTYDENGLLTQRTKYNTSAVTEVAFIYEYKQPIEYP
jgi:hypothetical protein